MDTEDGADFTENINPDSLTILTHCKLEPSLAEAKPGDRFQFERRGYFCVDVDSTDENPIINRTITLRDTWEKISKQQKK